jgi:DNA adenine methylase
MTDDDHRRLCGRLARASAQVVLSGYACPLYDEELVGAWERDSTAARGDRGTARTEVVWIKPSGVTMPAPISLVQPSFLEASNG